MVRNKKIAAILLGVLMLFLALYYFNTFYRNPKIKSGKEITFFVTTDIHYLAKDLNDGGQAFKAFESQGDGKQLGYIDEIVDAFTDDIRKKTGCFDY